MNIWKKNAFVQCAFLLDGGQQGGNAESVFSCLFDENATDETLGATHMT
jgi:hypothetical protein